MAYNEDQPRAEDGKWASGGGGARKDTDAGHAVNSAHVELARDLKIIAGDKSFSNNKGLQEEFKDAAKEVEKAADEKNPVIVNAVIRKVDRAIFNASNLGTSRGRDVANSLRHMVNKMTDARNARGDDLRDIEDK